MKKQKRNTKENKATPSLVVFLLDRTGSMNQCKEEAINGFNGYVEGLKKAKYMLFTLVQFDTESTDTIYESVPLRDVKPLNEETYQPRSMTNLYDVIGQTIRATQAKCGKREVQFITLTDGLNNASHEWTLEAVRKEIKARETDGWVFAHIGCGPQGWAAMQQVSLGTQSSGNVLKTDAKNIKRSMMRAGGQAVAYACSVGILKANMKADYFAGDKDDTDTTTDKT